MGLENVFYDILERKNALLDYKNNKFKKSKNWHFPKGLSRGFDPKMEIFATFFFRQNRLGKCLLLYSSSKKRFPRQKNKRILKSRKIDIFQKGFTHDWVQKWPFFKLLFLRNIGQENVFYDILERKNAFLGYKVKYFKKLKNWHFSNGVNPWFRSKNAHFSNFLITRYKPGKCLLWYARTKKRLSKL